VGLVRYFQATNIRHKCRNPLFLAIRFSNVLAIARDASVIPVEDESCYWSLFQALGLYYPTSSTEVAVHTSPSGTPVWFLCIREPQNMSLEIRKFVTENVSCTSLGHVGFANDLSLLPSKYKTLENIPHLKRVYEKMFVLESRLPSNNNNNNTAPWNSSPEYNEVRSGDYVQPANQEWEELSPELENKSPSSDSAVSEQKLWAQDDFFNDYPLQTDSPKSSCRENMSKEFISWFHQLHKDLKKCLEEMNHYASRLVMKPDLESFQQLKIICERFRRSLKIHSFIEDHTLFYEIGKRLPGLVEAYHLDHNMESGEVKAIVDMVNTFDPQYAGDLFLRITGFTSQFLFHMEKEEEHLVPRLLNVISSEELSDLFGRLRNEIAGLEVTSD